MIMEKTRKFLIFIITLVVVAGIIVAAYFLSGWLFTTINIDGQSMYPTIHDGDVTILYKQGDYERGDIVVFNTHKQDSQGNERYFVKRIIAMGGDTVKIDLVPGSDILSPEYGIYVNGEYLEETYLPGNIVHASATDKPRTEFMVPEGCFYYCGDNRLNSSDSRTDGSIGSVVLGNVSDILGRVVAKYPGAEGVTKIELVKRGS